MKYYFAAWFDRNEELRRYRDELVATVPNSKVTSRWIDLHPDIVGEPVTGALSTEKLNEDPRGSWQFGQHDLRDIEDADVVVSFTGTGGRGGRHVEFGYALALERRMVLVGERENVFHTHPFVDRYATWAEFLAAETALIQGGINATDTV